MKVSAIAFGGKGVVRDEGKVVFVPDVCPGEDISFEITKSKKSFAEGTLTKIHSHSPDRRKPKCSHAGTCGGCQLQHMNYPAQIAVKKQFIEDGLTRIAGIQHPEIRMIQSPTEWSYREHIRLTLKKAQNGFVATYTARDNRPMPVAECCISQFDTAFFSKLQMKLLTLDNFGIQSGSIRLFIHKNEPVLAFSFAPHNPRNCAEWSKEFPICLFRSPVGTYTPPKVSLPFSPYGFMQCNTAVAEAIHRDVLSKLKDATSILDLYGGDGALAEKMCQQGAEVLLIEANRLLCTVAKKRGVAALTVQNTPVEDADFSNAFDHIYLNPPREGVSKEALEKIATKRSRLVTYLSCNPATLARDLKHFISEGYTLTSITGYDMFPQTTHVETLVTLSL